MLSIRRAWGGCTKVGVPGEGGRGAKESSEGSRIERGQPGQRPTFFGEWPGDVGVLEEHAEAAIFFTAINLDVYKLYRLYMSS